MMLPLDLKVVEYRNSLLEGHHLQAQVQMQMQMQALMLMLMSKLLLL